MNPDKWVVNPSLMVVVAMQKGDGPKDLDPDRWFVAQGENWWQGEWIYAQPLAKLENTLKALPKNTGIYHMLAQFDLYTLNFARWQNRWDIATRGGREGVITFEQHVSKIVEQLREKKKYNWFADKLEEWYKWRAPLMVDGKISWRDHYFVYNCAKLVNAPVEYQSPIMPSAKVVAVLARWSYNLACQQY